MSPFSFTTFTILFSIFVVSVASPLNQLPSRAVTNTSKAGLTSPSPDAIEQFTSTGKVSWFYTWSPHPNEMSSNSLEFVPMLWGQRQVQDFQATINQTISDLKVTQVLGMNEPQQEGQSNLTPQQGVDMWKTYLEPLKAFGVRLGSPAPSSAPSGLTWLQEFLSLCNGGCTVDFIALHYYDVNATDFKQYLQRFHDTFQRPLWVTEWACQNFNDANKQCSQDDIILFLNETQSFMDQSDFVERYAFFGAGFDNLQGVNQGNAMIDSNDKMTDLGLQYIGSRNATTSGSGNADGPNAPGGGGGGNGVKWKGSDAPLRFTSPSWSAFLSYVVVALCLI